ncbi:helix-turn-helix transcriptional regulator [Fulvimarina sp. 2208YS6-2-32]|uniref:Helix-turn-helix transcriptional regulator n=1 Tax=Fulvimarina uroteuthidis TaxID=3098149 RepID=A0ABU5I191_9HYPH|nr:helix-turn-helix transcriptional regulator [Fulvimarina sp. 2208YS6-2-32]MDY8108850.1 helix-turn-helix transcriptional regulator [Fulvimarina sp. 2208YS6-2-32]
MAIQAVPNEDTTRQRLRKEGGFWLRQRREAAGLSQRELAERVDVGYYTFVSQIEAGRGRIPAERYSIWADALDMNAKDFVRNIMAFYEPTTYEILFGDAGPNA